MSDGSIKTLGVVTHVGEITFPLSLNSVIRQGVTEVLTISHVYPMHKAFNLGLDHAYKTGYDYMFLLAGDTILKPGALKVIVEKMFESKKIFIVSGVSDDLIFGRGPGGFLLYNMHILRNCHRYKEGPLEDIEFVIRTRQVTGCLQGKIKHPKLTIHHPVWTPEDIFLKLRFCLPKFKDNKKLLEKFRSFLDDGLKNHPENMVFIVGNDLYNIMEEKGFENYILPDKNTKELRWQWEKFKQGYNLTGKEFYAMPEYEVFAANKLRQT